MDNEQFRGALERTIHSLISRERDIKEKLSGAENQVHSIRLEINDRFLFQIHDLRLEVRKLRHSENSFDEEKKIVLEQVRDHRFSVYTVYRPSDWSIPRYPRSERRKS